VQVYVNYTDWYIISLRNLGKLILPHGYFEVEASRFTTGYQQFVKIVRQLKTKNWGSYNPWCIFVV
jgi:hypothetical protein